MLLNAGSGDFRTENLSLGMFLFSSFPRGRTNWNVVIQTLRPMIWRMRRNGEIRWERAIRQTSVHTSSFKHSKFRWTNFEIPKLSLCDPWIPISCMRHTAVYIRVQPVTGKRDVGWWETHTQSNLPVSHKKKNPTPPCALDSHPQPQKDLKPEDKLCVTMLPPYSILVPQTPLLFFVNNQLKRPQLSRKHCPPLEAAGLHPGALLPSFVTSERQLESFTRWCAWMQLPKWFHTAL